MHNEIRYKFGPIHEAKGREVYDDYMAVNRAIYSKLRMRQRTVLKQLQDAYDATAPSRDITEQLNGSADFFYKRASATTVTMNHAFQKRSRITKTFFYDKSVFRSKGKLTLRLEVINKIISLYAQQKCQTFYALLKHINFLDIPKDSNSLISKVKKRKIADSNSKN